MTYSSSQLFGIPCSSTTSFLSSPDFSFILEMCPEETAELPKEVRRHFLVREKSEVSDTRGNHIIDLLHSLEHINILPSVIKLHYPTCCNEMVLVSGVTAVLWKTYIWCQNILKPLLNIFI